MEERFPPHLGRCDVMRQDLEREQGAKVSAPSRGRCSICAKGVARSMATVRFEAAPS